MVNFLGEIIFYLQPNFVLTTVFKKLDFIINYFFLINKAWSNKHFFIKINNLINIEIKLLKFDNHNESVSKCRFYKENFWTKSK